MYYIVYRKFEVRINSIHNTEKKVIKICYTQHKSFNTKIKKSSYKTETNCWILFHIKLSDSYLPCFGGLSSHSKQNANPFNLMPGVCHSFSFDY